MFVMHVFWLAAIAALLCSTAVSQETCSEQADGSYNFKDVVLQSLIDATVRFFTQNSIGSNGFSNIQEGQTYMLYELFQLRYGDAETSTAQFVAGYLDIINTNLESDSGGTVQSLLAEVVGLIVNVETDAARSETAFLIAAIMRENPILNSVDRNQLTEVQRDELRLELATIFTNIQNAVTPSQFEIYLSLNVGTTLSFAIDTTGSMASEIEAAVERVTLIIESSRDTVNMPIAYVLSPFNDPGVGPLTKTSDPDVIVAALNDLRAVGGGDLPELALAGILNALVASTRRSVLFLITDAAAKDFELESRVISIALIRKIRIISLLTNEIGGDDGFVLYDRISSSTGGLVTVTDKDSINSITELFTALTDQGQVQLMIVSNSFDESIFFDVDSTVTSLSIILSGEGETFITSYTISYRDHRTNTIFDVAPIVKVSTQGLIILEIQNPAPFRHNITFEGDLGYRLEVLATSVLGALPTLFETVDGDLIHREQPRQGNQGHMYATAFGDLQNVILTNVYLLSTTGETLSTNELMRCGSEAEYRTAEPFVIPNQPFFILTAGYGNEEVFSRMDPCLVTPLATENTLENIRDVIVDAGDTISVTTTLNNLGDTNDFTFDVFDSVGYASLTGSQTVEVVSNSSLTIEISITVPSDAENNFISRVTVTTTTSGSNEFLFIYFNIIVRNSNTITCPTLISSTGSTLICTNFNNLNSVCSLMCSPEYVPSGESSALCQSNGTWTYPDLGCQFVGSESCVIAGDPHYTTFDGRNFDFQGTCIYDAATTTDFPSDSTLESFSVKVENERRGRRRTVSFFKRAFVEVYNQTFVFYQGRQLTVNGAFVTLPFEIGNVGLSIAVVGINIIFQTRFGLEIRYNGDSNFRIILSSSYADYVNGLCGNLNGDSNDEFELLINGTASTITASEYGNSFEVGGTAEGCDAGEEFVEEDCLDRDAYADQCNILESDCFEQCRSQFQTPNIFNNCLFDMCITEGDLSALEQAISDYAQGCQSNGIPICDWRNETGTPLICPPNSHYEQDGSGCPNTCLRPTQASRCNLPTTEGCQCDDGFVLSGTTCVPLSQCGCSAAGIYYMNGASFYNDDCSQLVTCTGGNLVSTDANCREEEICGINPLTQERACQPESVETCTASGDPHFTTFDGLRYDFQGACNYTFVEYSNEGEYFSIVVELINRNDDNRFSYVHRVLVTFLNENSNVSILLGVFDKNFPEAKVTNFVPETLLLVDYQSDIFTVSQSGRGIILRFQDVLIFYRTNVINIDLPNRYNGRVLGLCGNYNGDDSDDFILPNGTVASGIVEFVEPYSVFLEYCSSEIPEVFVCPQEDRDIWAGIEFCGRLINSTYFEECRDQIDLTPFYENCVFDLCGTNGDLDVYTDIFAEVVEQCGAVGVTLCDWREEISANILECPANSQYQGCTSACPNTCLNQYAENICSLPNVEGCQCDFGYVWNDGECVRLQQCGCNTQELGNVAQGFSYVDQECTSSCVCAGPGNWKCEEISCSHPGQCLNVDGQNTCVYPEPQECIAAGDPHFTTFDGLKYDFQGICNYTFVRYEGPGDDFFDVTVEFVNRNNDNRFSYVYTVRFEFYHESKLVTIDLRPEGDRIQALVYNLFEESKIVRNYDDSGLKIFRSGRAVVVEVRGFIVTLNTWFVKVILPYQFINKTSGLCGNYDGDNSNEYMLANGSLATSLNQFASSYLIAEYCPDTTIPEPFVCPSDQAVILGGDEFCGAILRGDIFANCRERLDLDIYYDDCVYDVCATEGDLQVLEQHFQLVVEQCKNEGLPMCNWREGLNLTIPECPDNSVYVSCNAQVPPRTCLNQEPVQMGYNLNSADACQCMDGFILQEGVCIEPSQCGCYPPDIGFVLQGYSKTDAECSRRCMCVGPNNWVCEDISCDKEEQCLAVGTSFACVPPTSFCVLSGEYISTFDNYQYLFGGSCAYTVVTSSGNEDIPEFFIIINKSVKVNGLPSFSTVVSISGDEEKQFEISAAAEEILVNGHSVSSGSINEHLVIREYTHLRIIVFNFGLSLAFTTDGSLVITLSGELSGNVAGLCGNFDRDSENDLFIAVQEDLIDYTVVEFTNYWKHDSSGQECFDNEPIDNTLQSGTCERSRYFNFIQNSCDYILDNEAFSDCRSNVNLNLHKLACTRDLCVTSNHIASLERRIVAYSMECSRRLVLPISLLALSDYNIDILCPENSHYVRMLDPCRRTCSDQNSVSCRSNPYLYNLPITEGCDCDIGYIWSGDQCVSANRCGCLDSIKGLYVKHGQCKVSSDCSEKCQCRGGTWDCEQNSCYSNQYCGTRDGVWGCHYTDQCLYENGGCSHYCATSQQSSEPTCSCPSGYVLSIGSKTCVQTAVKPCGDNLAQWRESYKQWKDQFNTYADYKIVSQGVNIRSCSKYGECQVYWTRWFNTDNATGCGDDESLERIQNVFPTEVCARPLAIDVQISESSGSYCPSDIILRSKSGIDGLVCNNADQENEILCPNYEVRFLCQS